HPPSTLLSFILTLPRPPRPTLFPYTTLFRSPPTEIPNRCAKVSAPLQLLHIEARITSAAVSKRFRCRKNLQHICGLAKFPQESKLSEETSPIRASLSAISKKLAGTKSYEINEK